MREPRPSARQRELLEAIVRAGPLRDYFHENTTRGLIRRGWIVREIVNPGPRYVLSITTRGRWALVWDDVLAEITRSTAP